MTIQFFILRIVIVHVLRDRDDRGRTLADHVVIIQALLSANLRVIDRL